MIPLGGTAHAHDTLQPLLVDIRRIHPHPENPKTGDTDAIIESIETNGVYRPVYINRQGTILAGNHTYAALLELGADQIPVITLDVDHATARRIMLADNRIADLGRYDDALLLDLLDKIAANDTIIGTGYTSDDVELLRLAQIRDEHTPFGDTASADLVIHGLTMAQINRFRDLAGTNDTERFLLLLAQTQHE